MILHERLFDRALEVAHAAHKGQVDKAGAPYIEHPIEVSTLVSSYEEKVVALLHDVCEDSPYTPALLLEEGFPKNIVAAVEALTHRPRESYQAYILRLRDNPLAKAVKLADLKHNMDLSRIPSPSKKDLARIVKYREALALLL